MKIYLYQIVRLGLALVALLGIPVIGYFSSMNAVIMRSTAVICLTLGLIVIGTIVVSAFRFFRPIPSTHTIVKTRRSFFSTLAALCEPPVYVPGKAFFAYEDILLTLPAEEVHYLRDACDDARHQRLIPENFPDFIAEARTDFKSHIRIYRLAKSRQFFLSLLLAGTSLIFCFGSLYLSAHVLTDGHAFVVCPNGPSSVSLTEALYFSVVTAGTVGYGDIHPGNSPLANWIVVLEVAMAFFFAAYCLNFGLAILQTCDVTPTELADVLLNELEDAHDEAQLLRRVV